MPEIQGNISCHLAKKLVWHPKVMSLGKYL